MRTSRTNTRRGERNIQADGVAFSEVELGCFAKNSTSHIRVLLTEYKGHSLVDIREWTRGSRSWFPSKSGTSIRVELLPELYAAIEEGLRKAVALGLLDLDDPRTEGRDIDRGASS
ncbi:hypothetical protein FHS55_002650 [Angulomicrobium tetraedrale]|uniref:Transcriptional coactivator p15 (PC4) C-terminal domain-containing protein n=1 Tax=Ancylobacter tetraedralis TaxID=217068 RepID=A0A839ZBE2_9HYPH|nr:transcriptional coactivator p15/PC4 family protein [Ancylobacter tetraedralis]MBB3772041.1 hypothetical protein [Ancylobacter tetraedralis]